MVAGTTFATCLCRYHPEGSTDLSGFTLRLEGVSGLILRLEGGVRGLRGHSDRRAPAVGGQ